MSADRPSEPTRRDFLTGKAVRTEIERAGDALADELAAQQAREAPTAGATIRLGKQAMACDFDVVLNPGPAARLEAASAALDLVDQLEDQMSVYRPHSELSRLNRTAAAEPVAVERRLFELLLRAKRLVEETHGGFDPTAGPLIALWRRCRREMRLPTSDEIASTLACCGIEHVQFDEANSTIRFDREGVELNLGSIGKGYALDRAAELLENAGVEEFLLHGGHSSLLARGGHAGHPGWPIGIRNPVFPDRNLGTLLLQNCGMSTSGTAVQHFRLEGKRYGHILDPRSGWPVEGMLSVVVLAPTAAEADALSTAFFVIGVENAREYCHNHQEVSALLIPPPEPGRRLRPINCGIPPNILFLAPEIIPPEDDGGRA